MDEKDIKPVSATIKWVYTPEEYLIACEEREVEPTQEGFVEWVKEMVDFGLEDEVATSADFKYEVEKFPVLE